MTIMFDDLSRASWLTESQFALLLGVTPRAIAKLRKRGEGPRFIRLSPRGPVFYTREDIHDFLLGQWLASAPHSEETESIPEL